MKTTVQALQDVYIQLGGALTDTYAGIAGGVPVGDYIAIPDMVEAVSKKASSGGSGSGVFVAHFEVTLDENENMDVITCDKTADEIVDAYVSNEFVCAKILFYETLPEVTAFDIYASDDQQDGKTLQICSHRVFVDDYAQASVEDALVSTKIYYDFVHEQWHKQEVGYALTPYSE